MLENLSGETRLFPILGDPVKYAKSPHLLTIGFESRRQNAICVPLQVPDGALEAVMSSLSLIPNVEGLLVTMPHKSGAFKLCATSETRARLLSAVSVIRRNSDGSWHGDTMDGVAFVKAQRDAGAQIEGARVLLVGAGGAGSAIALALLESGVRELVVHDTSPARLEQLINVVSEIRRGRVVSGPPDPAGCQLVCNATPMGMSVGDPLAVAAHLLKPSMFVGDVIAGHGETPLLKAARAAGCRTADGDQMVEAVQEMMLDFLISGR